jgi:hypothetical protein
MLSMIGEWRQSASIPKQAPAASPPLVNDLFGIRQMLALLMHRDNTCDHVFNSSKSVIPHIIVEDADAHSRRTPPLWCAAPSGRQ